MPELPEVEAARKAIEDNCLGKRIKKSIVANDSKVIDGVSASDFEASLSGKTIIAAHRKGKNLWLELDSPPFPSFQFGMTGAVYIKGVAVTKYKRSAVKDGEEWPSKYSKVFIELGDGMEFSFTDKRRFAKVRLLKDPASVPPISELGPDALLEPMTEDEFVASLSKKKIAIKPLLLDQGYISGIGNWIADEVLYQAKIHPLQVASSLSKESCATLQKCIKEVIEKAVEVGADNSQYPNYWIFHTREKKPGKAFVDGKKIEFITVGGRTTAFVPELQKLTGNQAAKAVNQQRKQSNQRRHQDESDSDDDDAQETDEGDVAAKTKGKKETKPSGQTKKKVPVKKKSEESDDGTEESDDGTDEEDNVTENTKLKKGTKAKGQVKKVPAKRKSEESDEGTAEEDNVAENTKPKKGTKAKGQVKKASAKRKSKESDDDEDDDGTDEDDRAENTKPKKGTKAKGQAKKNVPAKRKSKESDEEENEDDGSGEDYKVQKKRSKKVTNDKQSKAGKATKKKVQPSQTIKNVKKK